MVDFTKREQHTDSSSHDLTMKDRKSLEVSGVKHVESFESDEFQFQTVMGFMKIIGRNMQMKNLDVEKGVLSISGEINSIVYLENGDKTKGFLSKLFK